MPGESISPNMNLVIPGVGVTLGPQWASDLNSSLTIIDSHNHSAGSGVQINPSGLDIISDLSMKNNNLTTIRSLNMSVQAAPLALAADLGCMYVSGVDLYFNDVDGNQIQITQNGGIAGSPGSISNLTSPASASYVAGTQTFVWQSDSNTSANMDMGSAILRNITASSFGLTLTPPTLSSNYTITLPTLPASTKILTINSSGNIGSVYDVDNATLTIASNQLKIADSGVGTTQLAALNVTRPKLAAVGQQISSSSGTFSTTSGSATDVTNLSVSITTTGRPVMLMIQPVNAVDFGGYLINRVAAGTIARANIIIARDGVAILKTQLGYDNGALTLIIPSGQTFLDTPAAGTYTYKVQAQIVTDGDITVARCVLVAYEL